MSKDFHISEAVKNGIDYLREEELFGKGSITYQARRHYQTALIRGHERAARYWQEVMITCRKLEHRTARDKVKIAA